MVVVLVLARGLQLGGQTAVTPKTAAGQTFDRHDVSGTWRGERGSGAQTPGGFDQKIPEPPLTEWGRQNLLYKSISHDAVAGKRIREESPGRPCPNNLDPCFSEDLYGVRANDPNGEYPAKDCEPLSTPAMYDYPGMGSMELMTTREGDRVFQFFEYHREWRTFWMNADHPKDLDPTYEGHSVARWEGDVFVVDTIGYNDKTMVTQKVGHRKSEAFHLTERFWLVDRDHLEIDTTYADPKAWGDKTWSGFKTYYKRVAKGDFQEFICSPREYQQYEATVSSVLETPKK
jgi:hypothetical protein